MPERSDLLRATAWNAGFAEDAAAVARGTLDAIGCPRVTWTADQRCCGFGGLFSFKLPETSVAMADDKLASLDGTEATVIVGSDTSCLLHLRGRAEHEGRRVQVRHIAQLLAAALDPTEVRDG